MEVGPYYSKTRRPSTSGSLDFFWLCVTDGEMDLDPLAIKPRIFNRWYKDIPVLKYSTTFYIAVQCRNAQNYVIKNLFYSNFLSA